ncbi:MAG TPA: hypothetical protein VGM66_07175 [Candidatus Udaeobacter sp.]|jgi:hypothetical protein
MSRSEDDNNSDPAAIDHETHPTDAEKDASAAKAFHLADDMEMDLINIENLKNAIKMMGTSDDADDEVGGALTVIADTLEIHVNAAREKREEIFHRTWSYACGKRLEAV